MSDAATEAGAGAARRALTTEWPHLRRAAVLSVAAGLLWLPLVQTSLWPELGLQARLRL